MARTLNTEFPERKYAVRKDARCPRLETTQRISLHAVNYLAKITLPFPRFTFNNKIYLGYALFGLRLVFSVHVSFVLSSMSK